MREIEFRGKRIDNNEWVYGSLVHITETYKGEEDTQNCDIYQIVTYDGVAFCVAPETVGQYTEIKDENGKKIFEGDIIDFSYDMFTGNFDTFIAKGKIVFEDGAFYVDCFENERTTERENYLLYSINVDTIEVIGNTTDNPKLLEE